MNVNLGDVLTWIASINASSEPAYNVVVGIVFIQGAAPRTTECPWPPSPSQCPGTARSAASAGRSEIMTMPPIRVGDSNRV